MTQEHNGTLKTDNVTPAKLTMVIPVWNQLDFTVRLVQSIRRYVHIPYKMVFVDNGSSDGTVEYLRGLESANPDRVKCIFNHSNRGFARATNQGMEHVQGHMLWLNNDVEFVRPNTIEALYDRLERDPSLGAIGPVTDFALGPQMVTQAASYPPLHPARFLIGFCMLVREDAWKKVGKLDEGFNDAGQDDLDYSIRIRKAGYTLAVNRDVFVHHFGGATQQARFDRYGEEYQKFQAAGREKLVAKWTKEVVDELFLPVNFSGVRVLVSVPAWGEIYPEAYINHVASLMRETKSSKDTGIELVFAPMIRSAICCARNELVRTMKRLDCTHLFFMDDDMLMPENAIHRLVRVNGDIVSGLCYLRTPPHFPSMFIDPDDGTGKIYFIQDWPKNQTIQVDAVGSACVLIKRHVFEKIEELEFPGDRVTCPECNHIHMPWPVKAANEGLWYLYGKARPGEHTVGEDIFFCKLARQAGFKIFVDTSVEFGHIGPPMVYDSEYFEKMREQRHGLPGISYQSYESAHRIAAQPDGFLTPEALAERMGGGGDRGELFKRLYAGQVGDGRYPGPVSAAGNRDIKSLPGCPV